MKKLLRYLCVSLTLASTSPQACPAQDMPVAERNGSAATLDFKNDIMAARKGDARLYVLLGSGFVRPTYSGYPRIFVSAWIQSHHGAVFTPISQMITTNTKTHVPLEIVYIWIEQGTDSLNVDLVRNGIFEGSTMLDMVDNEKAFAKLLRSDPKLANERAEMEKERAAAPQDRTYRLVSDDDYRARVARIEEADLYARSHKLGIWSDAMNAERIAEGVR